MRIYLSAILLLFIFQDSNAQGPCNMSAFPSQMLQNSDFMFTNNENGTVVVRELTAGWPNGTAPGIDNDADHTSGVGTLKFIGTGADGWVVTSPTTPLGIYQFERDELGTDGCLDTVTVEVVMSLPVEWSEPLNGIAFDDYVELSFSTAQEINNLHFEIEQSKDGRIYDSIGKIEGQGTTSKETDYEYVHENPIIGINYYRIKQVDFDGQYNYSNVASVSYEVKEIRIYPNPVSQELNIISKSEESIQIYSHLGELVGEYLMDEGQNSLDISNLRKGMYLVKFTNGEVKKVIKN